MATPAPALVQLLRQINERWPGRSRASDGLLGDARHQARVSDHNTGNALDITHDEATGPPLEDLAEVWIQDPRVHYLIFRRRIRNRDFEDGVWRPYDKDPHDHHLHVSIHPVQRDDVQPWILPEPAPSASAASPVALVVGIAIAAVTLGIVVAAIHTTQPPLPNSPPMPPA